MKIPKKIKTEDKQVRIDDLKIILCDFADWLHKKGYIDADYYAEEPKAVDAYLNYLTIKNNNAKI